MDDIRDLVEQLRCAERKSINIMNSSNIFDAPWGLSLKLLTVFSTGILIGISIIGLYYYANSGEIWLFIIVILPLVIVVSSAFFIIRGYEISNDKLFVRRLIWDTEIDLDGLQSIVINPVAMKRSIRIFGNGGLFCFSGLFRNRLLGYYRAYATNPKSAVVLKLSNQVVVVTPDNPTAFAAQIKDNSITIKVPG
jgi:hypothetical protein